MQNHYLPTGLDNHDCASAELFDNHSLNALCFLIEHGRELEFVYCGHEYFLSCSGSKQYVSLWSKGTEQSFAGLNEFINNATLQGIPFLAAWDQIELQYLF